jgi:hypothetical protein
MPHAPLAIARGDNGRPSSQFDNGRTLLNQFAHEHRPPGASLDRLREASVPGVFLGSRRSLQSEADGNAAAVILGRSQVVHVTIPDVNGKLLPRALGAEQDTLRQNTESALCTSFAATVLRMIPAIENHDEIDA